MHTFKPERLQYQVLAFNEQMSFLKDNVTSSVPSDYIIKRLVWYLENHAVASSFDRYYKETELFFQSLKETVLNLPWAEEIKKKSPFAKALLEYNYNLRAPYLNPFMADITDKACYRLFLDVWILSGSIRIRDRFTSVPSIPQQRRHCGSTQY